MCFLQKCLDDLHCDATMDEVIYIYIMSLPTLNGRLWGDCIVIY